MPGTYPIQAALARARTSVRAHRAPTAARRPTSGCVGSARAAHVSARRTVDCTTRRSTCSACWSPRRGTGLPEFLRERIFEPLGMRDTGFSVPPASLDRLATQYVSDGETGAMYRLRPCRRASGAGQPAFPSGSRAASCQPRLTTRRSRRCCSTAGDAARTHPVASERRGDDDRSSAARAEGGCRHLAGLLREPRLGFRRRGDDATDHRGSDPVGAYGWEGGLGTSWRNDPSEQLFGVLLTQAMWTSPTGPPVYEDFWTGVYQAIDD